jgi:hypothetical protein
MVIPSEKAHLVVGIRQGGRDEVRGLDDGIAPEVGVHDPRAVADGPEPAYGDEDILAPPHARRPHHRVAGQPRPIIVELIPDAEISNSKRLLAGTSMSTSSPWKAIDPPFVSID